MERVGRCLLCLCEEVLIYERKDIRQRSTLNRRKEEKRRAAHLVIRVTPTPSMPFRTSGPTTRTPRQPTRQSPTYTRTQSNTYTQSRARARARARGREAP